MSIHSEQRKTHIHWSCAVHYQFHLVCKMSYLELSTYTAFWSRVYNSNYKLAKIYGTEGG